MIKRVLKFWAYFYLFLHVQTNIFCIVGHALMYRFFVLAILIEILFCWQIWRTSSQQNRTKRLFTIVMYKSCFNFHYKLFFLSKWMQKFRPRMFVDYVAMGSVSKFSVNMQDWEQGSWQFLGEEVWKTSSCQIT